MGGRVVIPVSSLLRRAPSASRSSMEAGFPRDAPAKKKNNHHHPSSRMERIVRDTTTETENAANRPNLMKPSAGLNWLPTSLSPIILVVQTHAARMTDITR